MSDTLKAFQAVQAEMEQCLIDRDDAITNALLALVSKQNFLMLGPPGTAKSMLVRELANRIDGAQYFEKLLSQFTVPEELFGPLDLIGVTDRGEYKRINKGSLSVAHVGFLDEVYKANSAILNALLTIANERLIHEVGFDPARVPLISLYGASNETPQDDSLDALDDRFMLRQLIEYVSDDTLFLKMLTARPQPVTEFITLEDITDAQAEAQAVKGTPATLQKLLAIREALSQSGVIVSDRRWRNALPILKAYSWMLGQDATEVEDLCVLRFALWRDPKDRRTVEQTIYQHANPLHLRALEVEDQAEEVLANLPPQDAHQYQAGLENALQQLVDMHAALDADIAKSKARDTSRADRCLEKVANIHKQLAERMFKRFGALSIGGDR